MVVSNQWMSCTWVLGLHIIIGANSVQLTTITAGLPETYIDCVFWSISCAALSDSSLLRSIAQAWHCKMNCPDRNQLNKHNGTGEGRLEIRLTSARISFNNWSQMTGRKDDWMGRWVDGMNGSLVAGLMEGWMDGWVAGKYMMPNMAHEKKDWFNFFCSSLSGRGETLFLLSGQK